MLKTTATTGLLLSTSISSAEKPELLAPAGTSEKLRWAVECGADAVYFGLQNYSLRSFAGNFTLEEAAVGLTLLHQSGKKGYAALNIYPFTEEYDDVAATARQLDDMGVDGIIIADLGVLATLKKAGIKAPLHISTQANTLSAQTVLAWHELGAKRVNIARELSIDRIEHLMGEVRGRVEVEAFIHGAVCFSYSGRCAISDYLTGRRANRGECTHACRWKYTVVEETRPGLHIPVGEDDRGLYLFNPKELALFPYLDRLKNAGVCSLKIEGRMKSLHYLVQTVSLYRRMLDGEIIPEQEALRYLSRVNNRGYSHGFMKGGVGPEDYAWEKESSSSEAVFLGMIEEFTPEGIAVLDVRNAIHAGEKIEVLTSRGAVYEAVMPETFERLDGQRHTVAVHPFKYLLPGSWAKWSILRRV